MTTLNDLVVMSDFNDVWDTMVELYPDQTDMRESYLFVFATLCGKDPVENTEGMYIDIHQGYDECQSCDKRTVKRFELCPECTEDKGDMYYDISGSKPTEEQLYGIEFCTWEEWLGYFISDELLEQLSKEKIIAHCLWEMTFISFDEEEIKETIGHLNEVVEGIENGTVKTIPFDEITNDLANKGEIDPEEA